MVEITEQLKKDIKDKVIKSLNIRTQITCRWEQKLIRFTKWRKTYLLIIDNSKDDLIFYYTIHSSENSNIFYVSDKIIGLKNLIKDLKRMKDRL